MWPGPQKLIFSQIWRLEIQDQVSGTLVSPEGSLLGLRVAVLSVLGVVFLLFVSFCVLISSFKDTSQSR